MRDEGRFMEIEGTYTIQATPHEVWNCLLDQNVWVHADSRVERMEQVDDRSYHLTIHLNQAPLAGTYTTRATITELHAPYYCRLTLSVDDNENGQPNTLKGYGSFHLNQQENLTIIAYQGDISSNVVDEMGASVSPLVMKGAIKLLLQQFFTTLAERVYKKNSVHMNGQDASTYASDELFITHEQRITIPSPLIYPTKERDKESNQERSRLRWFVHLLHIGRGNPAEEIRWTQRIRRYSIASVLLFLVWVGTRIPRR